MYVTERFRHRSDVTIKKNCTDLHAQKSERKTNGKRMEIVGFAGEHAAVWGCRAGAGAVGNCELGFQLKKNSTHVRNKF